VGLIYDLCRHPKLLRDFSLIDQIKRAVISIVANIAEGYGRDSLKDKAHFLTIALGSSNLVQALLDILRQIYGIDIQPQRESFNQLGKQIWMLRQSPNK